MSSSSSTGDVKLEKAAVIAKLEAAGITEADYIAYAKGPIGALSESSIDLIIMQMNANKRNAQSSSSGIAMVNFASTTPATSATPAAPDAPDAPEESKDDIPEKVTEVFKAIHFNNNCRAAILTTFLGKDEYTYHQCVCPKHPGEHFCLDHVNNPPTGLYINEKLVYCKKRCDLVGDNDKGGLLLDPLHFNIFTECFRDKYDVICQLIKEQE